MPPSTLIIVLGSTAAGKSTYIDQKYGRKEGIAHVCWDDIAEGIKNASSKTSIRGIGAYGSLITRTIREYRFDFYYDQTRTAFFNQLTKALKEAPTVVVDCPSFSSSNLIPKVIEKGRDASCKLVVEGLWVDPPAGIRRRLQGLLDFWAVDNETNVVQVADFFRNNHWLNFLYSCQKMPSQFMQIASQAQEARLFDNNGEDQPPRLVATWNNGRPQAQFSPAAIAAFRRLGKLDPHAANFSATCSFSQNERGKTVRTVRIETTGLGSA